eukprot:UN26716
MVAKYFGSQVAVKVLNKSDVNDKNVGMLIKEAECWHQIPQHPNIARFIGICDDR